ncbi:MAG: signal recognition particle protein [Verrucomicrobia bacterium GWF2_51_19]|nr:MAG: signal recognition particle protein [Verrucomicrobia bacterium GWF2_51_19]HCJ11835.1 signal recognition particle protein [Opitutae bacterium]
MFESLTEKLSLTFRKLRGLHVLTEDNMLDALKDIRMALLSADVHFSVVKTFLDNVKTACAGQAVVQSISPGQQIIKAVHDELVKILGEGNTALVNERPLRLMLVGLQGSGKTTAAAKLARKLKRDGYNPLMVACDIYRPAAIDQLEILAQREGCLFFADRSSNNVVDIAKQALDWATKQGANALIFDTAGRLHIDEVLLKEIQDLKAAVSPQEVLLVADSALGQEAVNVAKHFHEAVTLTGIILTKMDGDARGGAALSMKSVAHVPIKFVGTGEKSDDFQAFHPDRMAQRILGMGDVVSLVERAQEQVSEEDARRMAQKMKRSEFDFNDFLSQMQAMKKMGSLGSIIGMIPGLNKVKVGEKEEGQLKRTEAIILSMTTAERSNPKLLNGRRRLRIAKGSGTQVSDVNQLLRQFQQMQKMMKMLQKPMHRRG